MCFLFFSCFVISNKNEKVATQKTKEAGTFCVYYINRGHLKESSPRYKVKSLACNLQHKAKMIKMNIINIFRDLLFSWSMIILLNIYS